MPKQIGSINAVILEEMRKEAMISSVYHSMKMSGSLLTIDEVKKVVNQMISSQQRGEHDHAPVMKDLDPKQRKILQLFKKYTVVTSHQIGEFFGFNVRTSAALCKKWVEAGFLQVVDPSKKARKYSLSAQYHVLLD